MPGLRGRMALPARGIAMVDTAKLALFAVEALGLVGVLLLFQRIIRTAKRRSNPVNRILADGRPSVPLVDGRTEGDKKAERHD